MTVYRQKLESFLASCTEKELLDALSSDWLGVIFPGIHLLIGCEQGKENHSEGDAAVHTSLVFSTMQRVCQEDLGRDADFIERLASLIHDWKKPIKQEINPDGSISFHGHEQCAALEIDVISENLNLSDSERDKLYFLISEHGNAHNFTSLSETAKFKIQNSPYIQSLCALQKADAMSCYDPDGGHLPVNWEHMLTSHDHDSDKSDNETTDQSVNLADIDSIKGGIEVIDNLDHVPQEHGALKYVHPIIIYPFSQPSSYEDLIALYEGLVRKLAENDTEYSGRLAERGAQYAHPVTVMNRQTYHYNARYKFDEKRTWNNNFIKFRNHYVERYSNILDVWSVDTCQMWLHAFGHRYDERKTGEDVYWLIPGDFNYASNAGQEVLKVIEKLPHAVMNRDQDLCVGEITVPVNSSKQLIDTYGTYGLLYNWFPNEAQEMREITDKPRTEFIAIRHSFLRELLRQRWYPYEQTIVILLRGVIGGKRMSKINLGDISDLPFGRDSIAAAMQQVERTERMLKMLWRERNEKEADWPDRFRKLDSQSEQIRAGALIVLQNLL